MIFRPFFLEFFESPKISPKILCAYHIKKQADHVLTGSTNLRNNLVPLPSPPPLDQMISFPSQGNKYFFSTLLHNACRVRCGSVGKN
jgi:hypothetical protein